MSNQLTVMVCALGLVLTGVPRASAQGVTPAGAPPTSPSRSIFTTIASDFRHVASTENAITIGIAGGLALAMRPVDHDLTNRARANEPLEEALDPGAPLGDGWVQAGVALGSYAIGRFGSHPRVQALGSDLMRAQLLNGVMTQALKVSFSRTRPDGSSHSFPSGHASAAFATATVFERTFGWKVGAPIYGAAAYVATSRLSENKHYASDVIFGAAVGIVAGRSVTVGRGANRFALSAMPMHGGAAVTFTRVPTL